MGHLLAASADLVAHLGEFGHQLDTLGLTTGQCGGRLAKREITQAHILEQLQRVGNHWHRGKEFDGFVHLHLQHVTNTFAAPGHSQGLWVKTRAVAGFTLDLHVGQETHADGAQALPFTRGATALTRVERKPPWAVAPRTGFEGVGKQFTDGVPEADVGGRATARGFADGGLIHFQHPVDGGETFHVGTTNPRRVLACGPTVTARFGGALDHSGLHIRQQHVARQRGLARAADTGDGHQAFQGHLRGDVLQVVHGRTRHHQPLQWLWRKHHVGIGLCRGFLLRGRFALGRGRHVGQVGHRHGYCGRVKNLHSPPWLQRVAHGVQQITPGDGLFRIGNIGHAAFCHQPPAAFARARANVDDVVGAADGVFVVLHHHQRVALVAQLVQGVQQNLVVTGVQADGGFVQHVTHTLQVAAQLRRQADTLRFATAEGGRATVQREVTQAHFFEEFKPALNLWDQVAGDAHFTRTQTAVQAQPGNPFAHIGHAEPRNIGDGHTSHRMGGIFTKLHSTCRGIQAGAGTGGTHGVGHVFGFRLGKGLFTALVVVVAHRVVKHLALLFGEFDARAHTVRAPAVFAVVREQAWVQLGVRGGANGTGAFGGVRGQRANGCCGCSAQHGLA